MVPSSATDRTVADGDRGRWLQELPLHIREPGDGFAPVMSKGSGGVSVIGWWPRLLAKGLPAQPNWSAPCAVVLDASAAESEEDLHQHWRRWLQLFNTLQFMPGACLMTADGLQAHDYDGLGLPPDAAAPAQPAAQAALNAVWQSVIQQTLEPLQPGLKQLARAGAEPPEVGLELADASNRVVADCELAWAAKQVVLLRPDQADLEAMWSAEGWHTVLLDDEGALVGGAPWAVAAAAKLGLNVDHTKQGGAA